MLDGDSMVKQVNVFYFDAQSLGNTAAQVRK
jgi:hypothetical protein